MNIKDVNRILWLQRRVVDEKDVAGKSRSCHRNLSTAWIDYRKAFDSVPHTWTLKVLQMYKISTTIINFLTTSMKLWKTNLYLNHSKVSTICELALLVKIAKLSVAYSRVTLVSPPFPSRISAPLL